MLKKSWRKEKKRKLKKGKNNISLISEEEEDDVDDIRQWNQLISPAVANCLQIALSAASDRYQSVVDFRNALLSASCTLPSFFIAYPLSKSSTPGAFLNGIEELQIEFSGQLQIIHIEKENEAGEAHIKYDIPEINHDTFTDIRGKIYSSLNTADQKSWQDSPYLALHSYKEKDAQLFFGRDREIGQLYNLLEKLPAKQNLLTVLAPSGAGKSSFLQAGLIPFVKLGGLNTLKSWECVFLTPNANLHSALKTSLDQLQENSGLLIIIDQFEELLLQGNSTVGELLKIVNNAENCKLIISLRNDFYREYISFIDEHDLEGEIYNLPQIDENSLAKIIRMPALKAHITFEKDPKSGRSLDEILLEEAKENPESLAALSFTLDAIFLRSPKGRMSIDVYHELGGIHGALAKRAENIFVGLKLKNPQQVFHRVFHQLIRVDENRIPRRLYASYEGLSKENECRRLTDEFIKEKLFQTTRDSETDKRLVSVAHEALIQQHHHCGWQRVMRWLNRERNNLLIRQRLSAAAQDWRNNNKEKHFLYSSYTQLKEIRALAEHDWSLNELEEKFVSKSTNRFKNNSLFVAGVAVLLLAISVTLRNKDTEVDTERAKVEELKKIESNLKIQQQVMDDNYRLSKISILQQSSNLQPATALNLLSEISESGRNWLWGRLLYLSIPEYKMLFGHKEEILSCDFSHDKESKYLLTSSWDDTAIIWDSTSGEKLHTLNYKPDGSPKADLEDARFSYDGKIVAASNDGKLYMWSLDEVLAGDLKVRSIKMPHSKIRRLFFSKDNKHLVCCGSEGRFSVWDWSDKNFTSPIAMLTHANVNVLGNDRRVYNASISPDGKTIISSGFDGTLKKWDWNGKTFIKGKTVADFNSKEIWWSEFSDDGRFFLCCGRNRTVSVFETRTYKLIHNLGDKGSRGEHKGDVRTAKFIPGSSTLVSACNDQKLRFWDYNTGKLLYTKKRHDNIIYSLAISTKANKIASSSADKLVNVYTSNDFSVDQTNTHADTLLHSGTVSDFDLSGDDRLITACEDGELRLWNIKDSSFINHWSHHEERSPSKALFINEKKCISADASGLIKLWSIDNDIKLIDEITPIAASKLRSLVLSKDKSFLAASFSNGVVKIWAISPHLKLIYNQEIKGMDNRDLVIDFLNENKSLAIANSTGSIQIRHWESNSLLKQWKPHNRKIFFINCVQRNGMSYLISCSRDGKSIVNNISEGTSQTVSHGIRGHASYASLGPDARFLITSSTRDNSIFIWDLQHGLELLPLSKHEEPITKTLFHKNGLILSSSQDGTVKLWHSYVWNNIKLSLNREELKEKNNTQLNILSSKLLRK